MDILLAQTDSIKTADLFRQMLLSSISPLVVMVIVVILAVIYGKHYLRPAFLICAFVMAIACSTMSFAIQSFGVYLKKDPMPIKKSLDLLDGIGFANFKVIKKSKIDNHEIVESLGTEDYIQWTLEDLTVDAGDPARYCQLFITYYELPDRVPHVPEECYTGGGFQKLASDQFAVSVDFPRGQEQIEIKYLIFSGTSSHNWWSDVQFPIMYVFHVNGRYSGSREDARFVLNRNIKREFSYFSKVEWKFFNLNYGKMVYPDKKNALNASSRLLKEILPVLEKEHWPEWEKE